jgi:hypothetical protein
VIDRRDAKLVHGVQKLDVAVLEFKTVLRGHVEREYLEFRSRGPMGCSGLCFR